MEEIYRAEITDMNENGMGITRIAPLSHGKGTARADGCIVFVSGAVTGDICDIRITEQKKNYAIGEIVTLIKPAPTRCDSDCSAYSKCGGCTLRHVTFDAENQCKRQTVANAFRRTGLREVPVRETLHTIPEHYRNKAILHCGYTNRGREFGYFSEKTNTPVGGIPCPLLPDSFNAIALFINDALPSLGGIEFESLYLRCTAKGELSVVFHVCDSASAKRLKESGFILTLTERFPDIRGILTNVGKEFSSPGVLYGERELIDELAGLKFIVSPEGFWQVNHAAAELLVEKVLEYAGGIDFDTCIDLYCGSGTFGLILSSVLDRKEAKYYGVELNPHSIADAKRNAALNGMENITFFCGDAADFRKKIDAEGGLVIIDPPRAGCSPQMLRNLVALSPTDIIYVSCSPNTLSRDCSKLTEAGYTIIEATPVNMFPRTRHVETVCLLSKLNAKQHIEINLDMDELDLTDAEKKATYQEIKDYVLEHSGLKVSSLYIAQVKQKCGIIERENYNKPKSEDTKQPQCPPEKEKAIVEALKHFGMI